MMGYKSNFLKVKHKCQFIIILKANIYYYKLFYYLFFYITLLSIKSSCLTQAFKQFPKLQFMIQTSNCFQILGI